MAEVAEAGVTHVIDMQIEFDDTPLGERVGVEVLWNPVDDDFMPKSRGGVRAGREICDGGAGRSAGEVVCPLRGGNTPGSDDGAGGAVRDGYSLEEAKHLIQTKRYVVDFAEVYVRSVEEFLKSYAATRGGAGSSRKDGERRA